MKTELSLTTKCAIVYRREADGRPWKKKDEQGSALF